MKAIVELTDDEYVALRNKWQALQGAIDGVPHQELITYTKRYSYGKYTYTGRYTDKLVELLGHHPDEDEIIMLVDSGYSHFGAHCCITDEAKTFQGHVYID